ncbi:unnamed protein product [Rotaria sordida]|uniref:Uncharacterized protein n=1 Tax=Rotaria sordida TaxID=392033 RepID=A0A819R4I7_9BILA|nr:unnamed protein product [Rotaria sordida]CAF4038795.1 unnamed protein product [Rotaria sordida]
MNEVIPIASLYADEHIPDELYVLVRDNLIDQLDARLYNLTNPTQYLTSVSWHGKEKLSLLMVAALNGYDEIVRILLAHCQSQQQVELEGRVAIFEEDIIDGMTAIQCACYRSHFIVAKTLIEIGGADVHHDNKKWPCYPLLIQASAENRLEIPMIAYEYHHECQTCEELDAIKDDHDRMWIETALIRERILLPRNDNTLMRPLLDRGDILVSQGEFPNVPALQLLLTCGHRWLNIDAVELIDGCTALHLACIQSTELAIIKCLVNAGAHIDCVNYYGVTPKDCSDNKTTRAFLDSKTFPHRLKCLCARLIADKRIKTTEYDLLTLQLNEFVLLHDCRKDKSIC